jgi:diacylglycerol kinase (ATP)
MDGFDSIAGVRQHSHLVSSSSSSEPKTADLVLVNPAAGAGRAKEAVPALRKFAERKNWHVDFCATQSREDLVRRAQAGVKEGRKRILVLGGDGTFQALVNAVFSDPDLVLGIVPAGAGNDLATALGLPQDPLQAAELLLDAEPCRLDAVRVRTADGQERLYIGGGGVGLDAEAARYAGSVYRNLRGRLRYLLSAIRALRGFHPIGVRAKIEPSESKVLEASVLLLGVLNTPSYGAGLRLAPEAETDDGKLDLVILEDLPLLDILVMLPFLVIRGELRTKRIQRLRLERVRIETDRPCQFHGDGEILGYTPVEVEVVPQAVRVLRPRRSKS